MGKSAVDLNPLSPAAGLLPLTVGAVTLSEPEMAPMWLIAPFKGKSAALAKALEAAHGLQWPDAGQTAKADALSLVWFGRAQAMLIGARPSAKLVAHAALADQSDAWVRLVLEGSAARDVLARVTPMDLRDSSMPVGTTARTELFHMQVSLMRVSEEAWQIIGFRSMAKTLVHDLDRAMQSVAARAD